MVKSSFEVSPSLFPHLPYRAVLMRIRSRIVLPPISTVGITSSSEDITKLTDKTRLAMLEAIEDLGRKRQEQNRIEGKKVVDFGKKENVEPSGERQRLLNDEGAPAS